MARAECAKCTGVIFTSVTAFDEHLKEGGLVHVHPSEIPALWQRPDGLWAFRPDERSEARFARLREERAQKPAAPAPSP